MSEHQRSHIYKPGNLGAWLSDHITGFSGSWAFIGLHTAWFVLWFVLHLDVALLTNIVSLEAIYLASLVLMSQNRSGERDKMRDDLEASEVSSLTESHQLLLKINQQQLEILEAFKGQPPTPPRRVTR